MVDIPSLVMLRNEASRPFLGKRSFSAIRMTVREKDDKEDKNREQKKSKKEKRQKN